MGQSLEQFDTKRAVYLLARLALSHRKALTRNEAAEFLWPDDFFDATRLRLRQELARLRRGLGPARDLLDTDEEWVRLVDRDLEIDVVRFEESFQKARQESDPALREQICATAIALSNEPFLSGYSDPWIDAERDRLAEIRYALLVDLAGLQAQRGDHGTALETAKVAVLANPLQEAGHLLVMQELGKLGHLSDALGQYQNLKRLLRDELSEAPSEAAEKLVSELRQPAVAIVEPRSVTSGLSFHVPAPSEPIYGREEMLAHLSKLLDPTVTTHRVVSLTGPGGIGKTRLANEAAMLLQEAYEGRIGWISMADISDPADIPTLLASSLGLTLGPSADPMERICALLPREPVLLVLDNLEQLLPEGIAPIRTLTEARSSLRLLMTSRVALNLGGERAISVGPLPLPKGEDSMMQPAMRVFLDPLLAEQGYQEPSASELAILREITEKLEGIPLALQLAAGRLRTVTPTDLLGQLDKRLDIVNRRSDAPERHRTIRAAVSGSFQALSPELQRMMGRLAIFRGGWTQAAAAEVCEVEDPLPLLEKLLDYSLIRVDREDRGLRFRMLETIRDYVQESIPHEDLMVAYRKHADWLIKISPISSTRHLDTEALALLQGIDPEIDNVREACRFCIEFDLDRAAQLGARYGRYWSNRSLIRESLSFYAKLFLHLDQIAVTRDLALASYWESQIMYIAQMYTPPDPGPVSSRRTALLCAEVGLKVEYALTFLQQSRTPFMARDYEGSLALVREAEWRLREAGDEQDVALAMQAVAMIRFYQGRMEEALQGLQEAMSMLGVSSAPFHQVQTAMMISFIYLENGEIAKAKENGFLALELAEKYGVLQFVPMIQEVCGKVVWSEGDLELAKKWLTAAASGWDVFGNAYQYGDMLHLLGRLEIELGAPEEALKLIASASKVMESKEFMAVVPCTLTSAARAQLALGNAAFAARLLGTVKAIPTPTRDGDMPSEKVYVAEIEAALNEQLGPEEVARIYAEAPPLTTALREAFP